MTDIILDLLITVVSVFVVTQYALSMRGHFAPSETMPPGARLISAVVLGTGVIYLFLLWFLPQPTAPQVAGLIIELLSLVLFRAAIKASREGRLGLAFNADRPDGIVTGGPYNYLRHPFYTSYIIFWTGWAIGIWSPWTLIPLAALVVIYIVAALGEERKFANSPLAGDYEAYRQRTGFFWPRLP